MNILVVDDDNVSRLAIAHALRGLSSEAPLQVASGQAAMHALAQGYQADLIVTDVRMPEINGIEMLDMLRQDLRYAPLPVMMVTSAPEQETVRQAMQIGVQGFILKPVTPDASERARAVIERFHASMLEAPATAARRLSITQPKYWSYLQALLAQNRKLAEAVRAASRDDHEPDSAQQAAIDKQLDICQGLAKLLAAPVLRRTLCTLERLIKTSVPYHDSRFTEVLQAIDLNLHWLDQIERVGH